MERSTSISLGAYFESFVQEKITEGRYKNVSEVIRAGLRLLEEEERRIAALRGSIEDGINSGIVDDFETEAHLKALKKSRNE